MGQQDLFHTLRTHATPPGSWVLVLHQDLGRLIPRSLRGQVCNTADMAPTQESSLVSALGDEAGDEDHEMGTSHSLYP